MTLIRMLAVACATLIVALPVFAGARTLTDSDYARAVKFLPAATTPLVDHAVVHVTWLDATHFWYHDHDVNGDRILEMDVANGKVGPAFDQAKLAVALGKARGKPIDPARWPWSFDFRTLPGGDLDVRLGDTWYRCDLGGAGACTKRAELLKTGGEPGAISPNGQLEAFVRGWNLWVRDLETGKETQLTTDGARDYGYATQNAGWIHGDGAIVRWSPDSTRIATYRQDQRQVGDMYTVATRVGHPKLDAWKYALPGDEHVFMIEPVVIDVDTGKMVRLKMAPEERLSTLCDQLACDQDDPYTWSDVKWAPDGKSLALVSTSRNRQHETFRVADVATGEVRTAFEFTAKDYYESGRGRVNWQYLPKSGQAIWPSEQTNWANLYLYDLKTGKELHPITTGKGNVDQALHVDRATRTLWFVGNDRTPGVNPYYRQFFKVDIDTGRTTLLTPEAADHTITMSPGGQYLVDSYSTPTTPPVTVLRAAGDGHIIATVAKADISRLEEAGWVPPIPITVKARDGRTTLYGMMFRPTNFDPAKKYPVVDYIYPGPQTGSVRGRSFLVSRGANAAPLASRGDNQALAELGFIVVAIDGMGTPWRSTRFHHYWYGDMGDNTLPDQVAAIRELAQRYPWIDIDRVGIWGHSGGGNATADAMFRYPDFFKVGWAESGNHDNRNYENDWGEKYQGLLVKYADGTTNYANQANELIAKNLKGHLMLVHGEIDDNVPVGNTYLVVAALIKANKDFDMLILPNAHHGYGEDSPYVMRRRWDYFVKYLAGNTPPPEFRMPAAPE